MGFQKINYDDKTNSNSNTATKSNYVTAEDLNKIKKTVNDNVNFLSGCIAEDKSNIITKSQLNSLIQLFNS